MVFGRRLCPLRIFHVKRDLSGYSWKQAQLYDAQKPFSCNFGFCLVNGVWLYLIWYTKTNIDNGPIDWQPSSPLL